MTFAEVHKTLTGATTAHGFLGHEVDGFPMGTSGTFTAYEFQPNLSIKRSSKFITFEPDKEEGDDTSLTLEVPHTAVHCWSLDIFSENAE